jgi:HK97 family phage portal protein
VGLTEEISTHGVDAEARAQVTGLKRPAAWLTDLVGGRAASGEPVTHSTASRVPTFWACASRIATDIGATPRVVHRPLPKRRGIEKLYDHPITQLLRYPCNGINGPTLFETLCLHALVFRVGMLEIVRDQLGRPVNLYLLDPISTTIIERSDGELFVASGAVESAIPYRDVIALHGPGYDGLHGLSTTYSGRDVLGGLLSVAELRGSMFRNGLMPSGVLEHAETLSDQAFERLRDDMKSRLQGSKNAWDLLILEEGLTYRVIGFDPEKAQLLDFQKTSDLDVCRIFGMPPSKVGIPGDPKPGEELESQYRTDVLLPWENRLEHELDLKLFTELERKQGYQVQHIMNWVLRARLADQVSWIEKRFNMGSISPNEIRAFYGEPSYEGEGGDRYYMQGAMMTIDGIVNRSEREEQEEPREPLIADPEDVEEGVLAARAITPVLENAIYCCMASNALKVKRCGPDFKERHGALQKRSHMIVDRLKPVLHGYALLRNMKVDIDALAKAYAAYHAADMAASDSLIGFESGAKAKEDAESILSTMETQNNEARAKL